jgi:uncharacterized protein (DUF433 family)
MVWTECKIVDQQEGLMSGRPVIRGSRLRVEEDILDNLDSYVEDGMTTDEAISALVDDFPTVENYGGAGTLRDLIAFRAAHEPQPTL